MSLKVNDKEKVILQRSLKMDSPKNDVVTPSLSAENVLLTKNMENLMPSKKMDKGDILNENLENMYDMWDLPDLRLESEIRSNHRTLAMSPKVKMKNGVSLDQGKHVIASKCNLKNWDLPDSKLENRMSSNQKKHGESPKVNMECGRSDDLEKVSNPNKRKLEHLIMLEDNIENWEFDSKLENGIHSKRWHVMSPESDIEELPDLSLDGRKSPNKRIRLRMVAIENGMSPVKKKCVVSPKVDLKKHESPNRRRQHVMSPNCSEEDWDLPKFITEIGMRPNQRKDEVFPNLSKEVWGLPDDGITSKVISPMGDMENGMSPGKKKCEVSPKVTMKTQESPNQRKHVISPNCNDEDWEIPKFITEIGMSPNQRNDEMSPNWNMDELRLPDDGMSSKVVSPVVDMNNGMSPGKKKCVVSPKVNMKMQESPYQRKHVMPPNCNEDLELPKLITEIGTNPYQRKGEVAPKWSNTYLRLQDDGMSSKVNKPREMSAKQSDHAMSPKMNVKNGLNPIWKAFMDLKKGLDPSRRKFMDLNKENDGVKGSKTTSGKENKSKNKDPPVLFSANGRRLNQVWLSFERIPKGKGYRAKCKKCQKEMAGAVGTMKKHLVTCALFSSSFETDSSSLKLKLESDHELPDVNIVNEFKPSQQKPKDSSRKVGKQPKPLMRAQPMPEEDEEEEDDDMGIAETFADYMPSKLKIGIKHPDQVVETASLSSVEPPDIWYELKIPDTSVNTGKLSALQLESITYASQQHEHFLPDGTRAGFLIGDGAGVGKGRTIAGIIYENYLRNRKKSVWVSISNDLKYDAERDLKDIGAEHIDAHFLCKMKYNKINSNMNGNVADGVLFTTYASLIGESNRKGIHKTRLKQIVDWCGDDFDGCIMFDECHRAKNLCPAKSSKPTKTGKTVLELQEKLPNSRVVYVSATGASEPKNMAYMVRLGIWGMGTPFPKFDDFINAVERRGVGAMEIVAMDLKLRGMYSARQLSFHGVGFRIEEVPLDEDIKHSYDESVKLWVEARQKLEEALELTNTEKKERAIVWCQFWASHQRFFKYLCIASKVNHAVRLAREAVTTNRCVVIGLQSTGEARTVEQLKENGGELSDFVSTAKGVFESLIKKQFPGPCYQIKEMLQMIETSNGLNETFDQDTWNIAKTKPVRHVVREESKKTCYKFDYDSDISGESEEEKDVDDDFDFEDNLGDIKKPEKKEWFTSLPRGKVAKAIKYKAELLKQIEDLGPKLPPNTLDQLIDELGGPEIVAEMTGRKGRVAQSDGQVKYESRSEDGIALEILNIKEKERFMNSEKHIAIISEAASSGISLQSDRRVRNQRRRVHITLELPWAADRAIQQFGRTHRSNQVNAPEYVFMISELAGERRFASIVAKRLESLGALTHGDRRATETRDLSSFHFNNKYGRQALESTMKTVMGCESPIVPPPNDYKGDFFLDIQKAMVGVGLITEEDNTCLLEKDYNNMSRFLNRIMGMPVDLQNRIFKYFTDTLAAIVNHAKKMGKYDLGILDLGIGGQSCKRIKTKTWKARHATGIAKMEIHKVLVERGLSWADIQKKVAGVTEDLEGFYLSNRCCNFKRIAMLAVLEPSAANKRRAKNERMFVVYRPNTGQQKQEPYFELKKKHFKVTPDKARKHWEYQYESSLHTCSHAYWQGNCRRADSGLECEHGLRYRTYHVLCGLVLNVWAKVEDVLSSALNSSAKMQVVRLKTNEGVKLVGTLIPNYLVGKLSAVLEEESKETFEETKTDEEIEVLHGSS